MPPEQQLEGLRNFSSTWESWKQFEKNVQILTEAKMIDMTIENR